MFIYYCPGCVYIRLGYYKCILFYQQAYLGHGNVRVNSFGSASVYYNMPC